MHDAAFARAAVPSPISLLRLPLRPYSVGHALWLQAENNPLAGEVAEASGQRIRPRHILEAIWTCSNTWRELTQQHQDWLGMFKLKAWGWRARHADLALAAAEFQNYRRAGSSLPPVEPVEGDGRNLGAPMLARLVQFLIAHLGKSEEEAMDYPLGLGYWHFATYQESQGALKIMNAAEVEFERWCELEEEKASSFAKATEDRGGGGHA